MSDRNSIKTFYERWGYEPDDQVEFVKFKNRVSSLLTDEFRNGIQRYWGSERILADFCGVAFYEVGTGHGAFWSTEVYKKVFTPARTLLEVIGVIQAFI